MSCRFRCRLLMPFGLLLLAFSGIAPAAAPPGLIRLPAEQARALGVRSAPVVAATGIPLEHLPATVEPALEPLVAAIEVPDSAQVRAASASV